MLTAANHPAPTAFIPITVSNTLLVLVLTTWQHFFIPVRSKTGSRALPLDLHIWCTWIRHICIWFFDSESTAPWIPCLPFCLVFEAFVEPYKRSVLSSSLPRSIRHLTPKPLLRTQRKSSQQSCFWRHVFMCAFIKSDTNHKIALYDERRRKTIWKKDYGNGIVTTNDSN